jgi:membrane dipeptidase
MCEKTERAIITNKASDIEKAKQEKKLAMVIGLQHLPFNISYYPDSLAYLHTLQTIGVRILQLTYQRRNLVGDGCGERTDCGLSRFGIQVIEEMNKIGLLIDLSHSGPKTTMEAIETSKDPVVFSHSNCRNLCDHVRNKEDELIKALAENGGVQGIGMFPVLLNLKKLPTIDDLLDHVEHVIKLVGIDHVGIGLDFSVPQWPPYPDTDLQRRMWEASREGAQKNWPELEAPYPTFVPGRGTYRIEELDSPSKWKASISKGLDSRGYSISEIKKVLGENFMRVFREVWRA